MQQLRPHTQGHCGSFGLGVLVFLCNCECHTVWLCMHVYVLWMPSALPVKSGSSALLRQQVQSVFPVGTHSQITPHEK
jgi:hypothetical protein